MWHPVEERNITPTWCPKPTQFEIIDRCIDCRDFCDKMQHCKTLETIVIPQDIHPECPLEDAACDIKGVR